MGVKGSLYRAAKAQLGRISSATLPPFHLTAPLELTAGLSSGRQEPGRETFFSSLLGRGSSKISLGQTGQCDNQWRLKQSVMVAWQDLDCSLGSQTVPFIEAE
jgi:hypothetical protein